MLNITNLCALLGNKIILMVEGERLSVCTKVAEGEAAKSLGACINKNEQEVSEIISIALECGTEVWVWTHGRYRTLK